MIPERGRPPLTVLGSMATRGWLADLAAHWEGDASVEATGGVDAARRVRAGESADVLVLAAAAMRTLEAEGFVTCGSLVDVAVSSIAVAVRDGDALPDLATAEAVRRAIEAAGRTGYSTGPSGDHLLCLLESWGARDALGDRLVQAPPGVPVGRLLADGRVDLAFQQRSELLGLAGVTIAGTLPRPIASDTVFSAGIPRAATHPDAARRFIGFLTSDAAAEAIRCNGMQPV